MDLQVDSVVHWTFHLTTNHETMKNRITSFIYHAIGIALMVTQLLFAIGFAAVVVLGLIKIFFGS